MQSVRKLHPCIRAREDSDQGRHINTQVLPSDSRRKVELYISLSVEISIVVILNNAFPKPKFPFCPIIRSHYGGTKTLNELCSWTTEYVLCVPFKNTCNGRIIWGIGWGLGVAVQKPWCWNPKRLSFSTFPTSPLYRNGRGQHQDEDFFAWFHRSF